MRKLLKCSYQEIDYGMEVQVPLRLHCFEVGCEEGIAASILGCHPIILLIDTLLTVSTHRVHQFPQLIEEQSIAFSLLCEVFPHLLHNNRFITQLTHLSVSSQ